MNNTKRSEILFKVTEHIYEQYSDIQESINFAMANVC